MVILYYEVIFFISLILVGVYAVIWHKHFDVYFTLMFAFIPVVNLGYVYLARAKNLETAIVANKIIYLGGCFLMLFIMLTVLGICKIYLKKWMKMLLLLITAFEYLTVLSIGRSGLFYKNVSLKMVNGHSILVKDYGPFHTVFYIMLITYYLITIFAMYYSFRNKNDVSNKIISLLVLTESISLTCFFGLRLITKDVEFVPLSYILAQIIYLIIIHRVCLYDIMDTGIDTIEKRGDMGFISFDKKLNYLGSSEAVKNIFPEVNEIKVDSSATKNELLLSTAIKWIKDFTLNEESDEVYYERNERIYKINISYLMDGYKNRGYQLFIKDDTDEQKYIKLLNEFNNNLKNEVQEKTNHIIKMHDNLIMSMAAMVESRDNSTGGHIKRTSTVVRFIVEEMLKRRSPLITKEFGEKLIKAAPMHDLGKIAIDDAILRKPGKYTPEEYEIMKTHASSGASIVHDILKDTDDEEFKEVAENVAHYHHERWDGSGYPEGLKGEEIPLESRIMAIADVYDALVSKRVYKEKMSYEEANKIILDGMGSQFDEGLLIYYKDAREKMEDFYRECES